MVSPTISQVVTKWINTDSPFSHFKNQQQSLLYLIDQMGTEINDSAEANININVIPN